MTPAMVSSGIAGPHVQLGARTTRAAIAISTAPTVRAALQRCSSGGVPSAGMNARQIR